MQELLKEDLQWCLRVLPLPVKNLMKERPNQLVIAGGYIRSCVSREKVNDIDLFSQSVDAAKACAFSIAWGKRTIETDNAITVLTRPFTTQFIHKWVYSTPQEIVPSFDFTIARAAIWFDGVGWQSLIDDRFYPDLAAKRLVY